jgi:tRNA(fMet)-specific endonuclease VapC
VGRLILDTGVLIAIARRRLDLATAIAADDDVALPAIVIAEFLVGVELDPDAARQVAQRAFLDEVVAVVPVADYTPQVAGHHAALLVHTRRTGQPRGAHDLIIAATARATGRVLVTTDARAGFSDLPEVTVRLLDLADPGGTAPRG